MRKLSCTGMFAALLGLASAATVAQAQDTITLKLAHPLPAGHYAYLQGIKVFTDAVEATTNGKVKFEVYPANQLGKDYLTLVNSGVADMAMIVTSYAPDKFPLSSVTELPGLYSSSCDVVGKFWNVAQDGGKLNESEYGPLGLKVLLVNTLPSYNLMTLTKKVETLPDVSGLKVYAPGAGLQKALPLVGAVPVRLTASELYDAATRGTIDGIAISYSSLAAYKVDSITKYSIEGVGFGSSSWIMTLTDKTWSGLPADVQQAMTDAGALAQKTLCQYMDTDNSATRDRMVKEQGHTVVKLSDEQVELWTEKLQQVAADWASQQDAAGKPGTELLEAMRGGGAN